MVVAAPARGGVRNFPGRIDAEHKAELSFRVPGKVIKLEVAEGERVKKGQLLAKLDATDYQVVVKDRQATYDNTKKDFDRAKGLVEKGHISRRDYDKIEASFKSASAGLEKARLDLRYTQLKAPFDGSVARRYIQQFEEVQAKQTVFSLMDNTQLEVKFDVPENLILRLTPAKTDAKKAGKVSVWAAFDTVPDKRFDLAFKEIATKADAKTQTFQVTYTMPAPVELVVLPGMTANVTADLTKALEEKVVHFVPVNAVSANGKLDSRVWVVDETSMTVTARKVSLGRMRGAEIEVTDGVEPGLRIVTAGSAYLAENMKVTLMKQTEQAEPRAEDIPVMDKQ
ncbi:MAG: efflux RND transporter periplasmic adaptor subunit [gamma proteobacterium endosymbiont of Lamellibrachia anaximandri]|nr:efflux RND transporter periplasmic adaptor subunit [gamma proteobacterium endosymbiont of Lamellibrachia anaximandri]MBL3617200.1 efflux RND transporter periplasmic adaptor subunit [gamma proteobacterium endosymbiont of Lamellibrachia anaximandri]